MSLVNSSSGLAGASVVVGTLWGLLPPSVVTVLSTVRCALCGTAGIDWETLPDIADKPTLMSVVNSRSGLAGASVVVDTQGLLSPAADRLYLCPSEHLAGLLADTCGILLSDGSDWETLTDTVGKPTLMSVVNSRSGLAGASVVVDSLQSLLPPAAVHNFL
jgi:hypothetical protein